jgi:chloramphenicol O-acetyltransferase type A
MEILNKKTWNRLEAFTLFSEMEYPFYSVTIPMDVTNAKKYSREHQVSFYYLLVWLCTKAVNSVAQFRLRILDEEIVRLDVLNPSFTDLHKGDDQFHIVTLPWESDAVSFCEEAADRSKNQQHFLVSEETDDLIYFSCTPWFDFTALTNEHKLDRNDLIPRIVWGKYYEEKERLWVHMSIEVNHRMIDGFHIGLLKAAIDREISALC